MKYESLITYHYKDIANIKVSADRQTDRPKTILGYAPNLLIWGNKNKILNVKKNDWVRTDLMGWSEYIKQIYLYIWPYNVKFMIPTLMRGPDAYFDNLSLQ